MIKSALLRVLYTNDALLSLTVCAFFVQFRLGLIAKKTESAPLPNVQDNVVNQSVTHNPTYVAIALAVHNVEKKMLYAVLADKTAQGDLKRKWKISGSRLAHRLKNEQDIFTCVPLDKNTVHLPLDDCLR